jgi:hypothetical protein
VLVFLAALRDLSHDIKCHGDEKDGDQ